MKEIKDFINGKGQDIRRIIDSGANDYTSTEVEIVKNILDVDLENDIVFESKYFHVRFLSKEDSVGLETGIDWKTFDKSREFLLFVTDADTKSSELMTWQIYRAMATQFTKGGYVDAARRWAASEGLEVTVEECENLAFCRWAFEKMENPTFYGKFNLTAMEAAYLTTFIDTESCTNIVFLKKNTKWSVDTSMTNAKRLPTKANDQGLGAKHAHPFIPKKKDSEVSSYMNPMGLPLRSSFDECMKLVIKNYGGATPGSDIDVDNVRYVRINTKDREDMNTWSDKRWKKEHVRFVYFDKVGGIGRYLNTKPSVLPVDYQEQGIELLEKVILPKEKLIKDVFNKYERSVKEYIVPHYNAYKKFTSVIDRGREESVVKFLMKNLIQYSTLTSADENSAYDNIIDRSVELSIGYLKKHGTYLSMNERIRMRAIGTLPVEFEASIPEWMH